MAAKGKTQADYLTIHLRKLNALSEQERLSAVKNVSRILEAHGSSWDKLAENPDLFLGQGGEDTDALKVLIRDFDQANKDLAKQNGAVRSENDGLRAQVKALRGVKYEAIKDVFSAASRLTYAAGYLVTPAVWPVSYLLDREFMEERWDEFDGLGKLGFGITVVGGFVTTLLSQMFISDIVVDEHIEQRIAHISESLPCHAAPGEEIECKPLYLEEATIDDHAFIIGPLTYGPLIVHRKSSVRFVRDLVDVEGRDMRQICRVDTQVIKKEDVAESGVWSTDERKIDPGACSIEYVEPLGEDSGVGLDM